MTIDTGLLMLGRIKNKELVESLFDAVRFLEWIDFNAEIADLNYEKQFLNGKADPDGSLKERMEYINSRIDVVQSLDKLKIHLSKKGFYDKHRVELLHGVSPEDTKQEFINVMNHLNNKEQSNDDIKKEE